MKLFKPEDFKEFNRDAIPGERDSLDCIAAIANARFEASGIPEKLKRLEELEKMLAEAPEVWQLGQTINYWTQLRHPNKGEPARSHRARLVAIEKIEGKK